MSVGCFYNFLLMVKGGLLVLDGEEELAGIKKQAFKLPFLIVKVRNPARN